ncbi:thermonuclease family protein [Thalassospira sp. MA62]|nr:thermonuclease family protein [Thalassospira sp. MA62]
MRIWFYATLFTIVFGSTTVMVPTLLKADPDYETLSGQARAVDADTLEFGFRRVDLWGADAMERFQTCMANGQTTTCGADAWQLTTNLLVATPIRCEVRGKNRYKRNMAVCRNADGTDIGRTLIMRGLAVARSDEMPEYIAAENAARQSRVGVWAGRFIDPLKWRRGERLPEHETEVRRWQREE